jgi:hypothetical protein
MKKDAQAKQKMFLVKREVMAINIKEAMEKPGRIYSIEEAVDISGEEAIADLGFIKPKK